MNWEYFRGLAYEYWYYMAFSLLALIVVAMTLFYVRGQFQQRRERLKKLHLYRVNVRPDTPPRVAGIDSVINGILFPRPEVHRPLIDRLTLDPNWGPAVREWKLRENPVPSLRAPSLRGPQ